MCTDHAHVGLLWGTGRARRALSQAAHPAFRAHTKALGPSGSWSGGRAGLPQEGRRRLTLPHALLRVALLWLPLLSPQCLPLLLLQ